MSLILDALNRADVERKNQAAVPDLNTQHHPMPLESDRGSWAWVAWLLVVLLAGVIAWFGWRWQADHTLSASTATQAIPLANQETPAINAQLDSRVSSASLSSRPPITGSVVDSVRAVIPPTQETLAEANVQELYAESSVSSVPADSDVNQLYAVEEAQTTESVVDPFATAPGETLAMAEAPEIPVEREAARTFDNTPARDFNDLPWNTKQKMPTISYQRHDYLAGGISSVVINGQTAGVGNIIATGQFVVQDILVDGVVLKQGEQIFKLRALNGWINM